MPIDEISAGYAVRKRLAVRSLTVARSWSVGMKPAVPPFEGHLLLRPSFSVGGRHLIFMPTHVHLLIILWQSSLQHTTLRPPARGDESKTGGYG
jgi:hypothetical protein